MEAIQAQSPIEGQDFSLMCQSLGNVLENVTLSMHPQVRQIKELMMASGADGVLMSGSGHPQEIS